VSCHQLLLVRLYRMYLRLQLCCTAPRQHLLHRERCGCRLLLLLLLLLEGCSIGC
jgi:hypothetical protein